MFQIEPTKPTNVILFIVVGGAIAGLIIFFNVSKRIAASKVFKDNELQARQRKRLPGHASFNKVASSFGLNGEEKRFLEDMFEDTDKEPAIILQSKTNLDKQFKEFYRTIKRDTESEDEMHRKLSLLFSIRNTIEFFQDAESVGKNGAKKPRRHRRKKTTLPCIFHTVSMVETKKGRKTMKKLVVSEQKSTGSLLDVSAGGCAIQAGTAIKAGARLKIEFNAGRIKIAALGQVLRINKEGNVSVFHTRFLKVPPKAMNNLNAFVYDYSD
jgi:hypothetical protein